jgi:hypothetical protein
VRHALVVAVVAACVIVPLACGDSSTGPDDPKTPVGNYALATFNGKAPPVTIFSDTNYLFVLADASLSLDANGSYRTTATTRETVLGHLSTYYDTTNGSWVQTTNSNSLVLTDRNDGSKVTMTWAGTKVTFVDTTDGVISTIVYARK